MRWAMLVLIAMLCGCVAAHQPPPPSKAANLETTKRAIRQKPKRVSNGETEFAHAEILIRAQGLSNIDRDAIDNLTTAAKLGNPVAQYDLGYCYEHGLGITTDRVQAYQWYAKAAKRKAVKEIATKAISDLQLTTSEQKLAGISASSR